MAIEDLTVKLRDGSVYYFRAGAIMGDPLNRVDLLRDAIDDASLFRSPDVNGELREFNGADVANYYLA